MKEKKDEIRGIQDILGKNNLTRRDFLKLLGAGSAVGALGYFGFNIWDRNRITGMAIGDYETVKISAGESRELTVGSGDTFENLVVEVGSNADVRIKASGDNWTIRNIMVDITANNADATIEASGDNWAIRNVGFEGGMDVGNFEGGFPNCIKPIGNGVIENCYMGDGVSRDRIRKGGIGPPSSHSGHIEIRNCYVARWTDNALYNADAATNGQGTVHVDNCYFHDNNVSSLRVACDGTVVENSIIHNTGETRALPESSPSGGGIDATGVYTGYGDPSQTVEVRNCHIDCRKDNNYREAFWSPDGNTTIEVYDTQWVGNTRGNVELVSGNGSNPDLTPPSSVPISAEEAAAGTVSGGSQSGVKEWTPITLTSSSGSPAEYIIETDQLRKTGQNGRVFENAAVGSIAGGIHEYEYKGRLIDVRAEEGIDISVNGKQRSYAEVLGMFCTGASGGTGGSTGERPVPSEIIRGESRNEISDSFQIDDTAFLNTEPSSSHGGTRALKLAVTDPNGTGIVENCYFEGAQGNNIIFVDPDQHVGTLIIRNCYIARAGSDALYAETAEPHGAGGEIHVENCYFRDNNVSHIRISKGRVVDTVVHNTNNVPPTAENNGSVVNSRGFATHYAGDATIEVENTHVDVTSENTNGSATAVHVDTDEPVSPTWDIRNSQIRGRRGDDGTANYENVGNNPDTSIPSGVPQKPDSA